MPLEQLKGEYIPGAIRVTSSAATTAIATTSTTSTVAIAASVAAAVRHSEFSGLFESCVRATD